MKQVETVRPKIRPVSEFHLLLRKGPFSRRERREVGTCSDVTRARTAGVKSGVRNSAVGWSGLAL